MPNAKNIASTVILTAITAGLLAGCSSKHNADPTSTPSTHQVAVSASRSVIVTPSTAPAIVSQTSSASSRAVSPSQSTAPVLYLAQIQSPTTVTPAQADLMDPVQVAAAFAIAYTGRSANDSVADNIARRAESLVAPSYLPTLDTIATRDSFLAPATGAWQATVMKSQLVTSPAPTPSTVSILVTMEIKNVNQGVVVSSTHGQLIVHLAKQSPEPNGTWLVTGATSGAN